MAISKLLLRKLQLWRLSRPRFLSSSRFSSDLPPLHASLPSFTVWGSNTSVGKTLVSAGLSSSLILAGSSTLYVKPVQTGFPHDSDSGSVVDKVCNAVTSSGFSATPRKVYVSNCIQKVSPLVAKARSEVEQAVPQLPPHIEKIGGSPDMHRYTAFLLESNCDADGRWHSRKAVSGEEYCLEGPNAASTFIATTMWSWFHAVSPHLAAAQEGFSVTDSALVQELANSLWNFPLAVKGSAVANGFPKWAIIETAGGVASPGPSGTLQCDIYRPLRLPGLLVGDGKLGGISSTITAYESLLIRGYDIDAVILFDAGLANHEQLLAYLRHRVPVMVLPSLPKDPNDDLSHWFLQSAEVFTQLQQVLETSQCKRIQRLQDMKKKASQMLWWPFTQHSLISEDEITVIDSRCGSNFMIYKRGREESDIMEQQFDGCASWWTQGPDSKLQPELARQIGYATGRFGHVMLPENVYEPALHCAELLIQGVGKGWADRVYYSDNGSTAIEIALKMAFRKYIDDKKLLTKSIPDIVITDKKYNLKVLALKGSYHGDTLGAQDAQAPSAYTGFLQQPWYSGRGLFLEPPCIYMRNHQWCIHVPDCYKIHDRGFFGSVDLNYTSRDDLFHEQREECQLANIYRNFILGKLSSWKDSCTCIAALIIEPVIHGAGGMTLIDPLFQRLLVNECKSKNIPVIFDEVFAGCWRLGVQSCTELLGCSPDIGCYSKLLTGGTVPLAATLASSSIFQSFQGDSKLLALLHGHSYSGHAIGCQAAIVSLQWFSDPERNLNLLSCKRRLRELWEPDLVSEISAHPAVQKVIALGTVFALELKTDTEETGYSSMFSRSIVQALRNHGIYVRPLGNVIYLMCGPATPPSTCSELLQAVSNQLDAFGAEHRQLSCEGF